MFFLLGGLFLTAFSIAVALLNSSNKSEEEDEEVEKLLKQPQGSIEIIINEFNTYIKNDFEKALNEFKWITVAEISEINDKYNSTYTQLLHKIQHTENELTFINNYKKYFTKNGISTSIQEQALSINDGYINKELEENKELFDNIDGKSLDYQQRLAAIINDNKLIVAGAGAGKTLTIAGTVKYLVDSKNIDPKDILLITYTKKAAEEMRERVVKKLNVDVDVYTFHALGNKIIKEVEQKKQTIIDDPYNKKFFDYLDKYNDFLLKVLQYDLSYRLNNKNYFPQNPNISNNTNISDNIKYRDIMKKFYNNKYSFSDDDKDIIDRVNKNDEKYKNMVIKDINLVMYSDNIESSYCYQNLKSLKDFFFEVFSKKKENKTFNYDCVKSHEELLIANYLFRNNIKYKYETPYEIDTATENYRQYHPDFYLPEHDIYIEHFGINRDGRTPQYTPEEEKIYLEGIKWKRNIHKLNHTKLIETYSYEFSEGKFPQNLHDKLEKEGVVFSPIPPEKLKEFIEDIKQQIITKNIILTQSIKFLNLFKNNNYPYEYFQEIKQKIISEKSIFFSNEVQNKELFFIEIVEDLFKIYENFLKEQKAIDFSDMINRAIIDLPNYNKEYKYIVIDEYQDTSKIKCNLIVKLKSKNKECKVMVVGDDWQSIYRFAGNDLNLFIHFDKYLGAGLKLNIENTYRNSQELVKIAGDFIMKNSLQIKKNLKSNIHLKDFPIKGLAYTRNISSYTTYDQNGESYEVQRETDLYKNFDLIIEDILTKNPKAKTIMILGRYSFDSDLLFTELEFEEEKVKSETKVRYKDYDFEFKLMTIHGSKGLEADEVILLINDKDNLGFPSHKQDDPIFRFVLSTPEKYPYAEERRLFYVATTRTKNRVYIIYNRNNPSTFIQELQKDNAIEILNYSSSKPSPIKVQNSSITKHEKNIVKSEDKFAELKKMLRQRRPDYRPHNDIDLIILILETSEKATSRKDFINIMNQHGYSVKWKDSAKHVTFIGMDKDGNFTTYRSRLATMNRNYGVKELTKEYLEAQFTKNKNK